MERCTAGASQRITRVFFGYCRYFHSTIYFRNHPVGASIAYFRFPGENGNRGTQGLEYFRIAAELRLDKELVINHRDGNPEPFYIALWKDWSNEPLKYELQEINYHTGGEFRLFNTGCLRQGFLPDSIGSRYEWHLGFGVNLYNHIRKYR